MNAEDKYISVNKFKETLANLDVKGFTPAVKKGIEIALSDAVPQFLDDEPAADVQLVKRGKWDGYICSECNVCADYFVSGDFYFDEKPNFCPNCGARMDLKDGDAE